MQLNTLANVRTLVRLYSDHRVDEFVSDTELTTLINLELRHLYDLLIQARGADYFAAEYQFATAAGTSRYNLPADHQALETVTIEWSQTEHELVPKIQSKQDRIRFTSQQATWARYDAKGYQVRGQVLELLPTPNTVSTVRLQYIPTMTSLSADGATFDFVNGWERFVAVGVAIQVLAIDKRTSATLQNLYQQDLDRIETMKNERDAEAPSEVIDVERIGRAGRPWYGPNFDGSFDPTFG